MDKGNILFQLRRVWADGVLLASMGVLLFITSGLNEPVLRLFAFKVLLFSASQLHAHITRQLLFPYIKFSKGSNMQKAMVIALHASSAYLYAQGG